MTLDLVGLSMFPAIRAGDRCRVQAVDPDSIRIGDVILVTREDRLFAHRVVSITEGRPRAFTIKGDTLLLPDPQVTERDILGQVLGVERRGRFLDLRSPGRRLAGRLMAGLSGPFSRAFVRAMLARRRAMARLARLPAWRAFRRSRGGEVVVRRATDEDVHGIALLFGEQQALHTPMDRIDMDVVSGMARRMLNAAKDAGAAVWVAEIDGFLSAQAVVGPLGVDGPDVSDWWVMSVYVKMTARGCGLAERLVRAGLEDARAHGECRVHYAAFETNRASLALAAKLGFKVEQSDTSRRFAARYDNIGHRGPKLVVTCKEIEELGAADAARRS
ncbi:MAG TPA: GNAT family N-acetyltransferase [Armatimonadota bacterium]